MFARLGRADPRTTARYVTLRPEQIDDVADVLDRRHQASWPLTLDRNTGGRGPVRAELRRNTGCVAWASLRRSGDEHELPSVARARWP